MNETLELLLYQLVAIFILFIFINLAIKIHFWNENRKLYKRTMKQIEIEKILWDKKIEAWKRRDSR